MKMKKILVLIFAIVITLSFVGCNSEKAATGEKKVITIGVMPDVDSIPFVMAAEKGFFEKEGVKVKLEYFKSAKDRDSAFQSGKLDGAIADMLTVLFDKDGGFDVKITSKTEGNYILLAGKASGIKTLKDIKGKSLAISKNTLIEFSSDKMLETVNFKGTDVHKMIVPQIPVRLEMLQNGKVDAATLPEPLASLAVKNGATPIYSTREMGLNPGVIMFSAKVISESNEEIKAVYRAYNDSVEFLNSNALSSYIDVLVKKAGFPEPIKDSLVLPKYTRADIAKESDFSKVSDWMLQKKLLKKNYEFKDCIDEGFVR